MLSILAGVGMLLVLRRASNPVRIRGVKRLVKAYLLEMRIYRDEPAVVWRSQISLLTSNLRYVALMLQPAVWLALPLALLLVHLDAFYGRAPLTVGREAIVTMSMLPPFDMRGPAPALTAPDGISVETAPLRALSDRQVSWRIRPIVSSAGDLRFELAGDTVLKQVEARSASRFMPGRKVSSFWASIWRPDESRIVSPFVEWIEVRYPDSEVDLLGIRLPWLIWFTVISMLTVLLFKKRFGVTL
jgi:hypothetical protein